MNTDPLLHLRRKFPCDISQDLTSNAVIVQAMGSGKERRIEDPSSKAHLTTALRQAYEDILREIDAEQQEQAA